MESHHNTPVEKIQAHLRTALRTAMKSRDKAAVAGVRSAMAALANAEAIDVDPASATGAIEQSPVGVGSTEAARRVLTDADVRSTLEVELTEREQAAGDYAARGDHERADRLRAEAAAVRGVLDELTGAE